MKIKVDSMPSDEYDCPFCDMFHRNGKFHKVCKLDGGDCTYFHNDKKNEFDCRWLIDDETQNQLRREENDR